MIEEVFQIELTGELGFAVSLDRYAAKHGKDGADVLLAVIEAAVRHDLFDEILTIPTCATCGNRRSAFSKSLCKDCYATSKRKPSGAAAPWVKPVSAPVAPAPALKLVVPPPAVVARPAPALAGRWPAPEPPVCSDCGGPRSVSSGGRCRACHLAKAAAEKADRDAAKIKAPALKCDWCGGRRSPGSASLCRPCFIARANEVLAKRAAPDPAPAPHVPRYVLPPPEPPRPVRIAKPAPREPQHPILERHASAHDEADPLIRTRERKKPTAPGFSPAFLAQLEKVRNGAPIVTFDRPGRATPDMPARGSSLSDAG